MHDVTVRGLGEYSHERRMTILMATFRGLHLAIYSDIATGASFHLYARICCLERLNTAVDSACTVPAVNYSTFQRLVVI